MTSRIGIIDKAARLADSLPLARIVACMLGGATAFFCYAMPPRMLNALFGGIGLSVPVGTSGRAAFVLLFALLAAGFGWLAMAVIGAKPHDGADESEGDIVFAVPEARRRAFGMAGPDAGNARAPLFESGAVQDGAGRGETFPRRPIFAGNDLGTPIDEIVIEADRSEFDGPRAAPFGADEPAVEQPPIAEEPSVGEVAVASGISHSSDPVPAEAADAGTEPLELRDALPAAAPAPAPAAPPTAMPVAAAAEPVSAAREPSLADLMARFEKGLDRRGDDLPPPPTAASVTTLRQPDRGDDDSLRNALEALQRMAARQR